MSFDIVGHLKIIDNATKPLRSMTSHILKFGTAAAGIAAAAGTVAIVGDSIKKSMDFESQLQSIKALTGATDASMAKINALALQQGALTKYSALESAQAIEELLKAGMSEATIMSGGLNAALNLATAGGLELAEAAETMATSMNAFKKDGLSAAQTANILAGTANAAATDVRNISYGIASAGGVADMAGLSFMDLNTAIGLMSNDGLKSGSDAGTSFKSMIMQLQPQTKKATALFNQLGIGVGKANKFFEGGNIKDLAGIAEVLNKTLGKMNNQDRVATLLDIFGTDGVKAATTLYKAGTKGVEEFHNEMAKVTALQVAEEKMNSAAGAMEQFQGAIETLQISAMSPLLPYIKKFALGAQELIAQWTPQITAAVQNAVDTAAKYLNTNFINNPAFRSLPTINQKIDFMFAKAKDVFDKWWEGGGRDQIYTGTKNITDFMLNTLEEAVPRMAEIGFKLGATIAQGVLDGLNPVKQMEVKILKSDMMNDVFDWTGKTLPTWMGGYDDATADQDAANRRSKLMGSGATPPSIGVKDVSKWAVDQTLKKAMGEMSMGKFSGGLDYVPRSGYAYVHQGESIQTATETRSNRNGGGSPTVMVTGNTFVVRNDADIDMIASKIALRLAQ
ncbi:phage tail tape measure protein [Paenibacillus sp. FSL R5-0713]|uniref:phage tail tape measure protein n=1 Tax=Paenibacillus sp. FSL R5-0713 TaxID=2921655 RepID=UPI0030D73E44